MNTRAANEASKRQPMDIFDPSGDGITGYTLAQTVKAASDVVKAFDRLEKALVGCKTPLDLATIAEEMAAAKESVQQRAAELKRASDIIELDLPVILVPMGWDDQTYSAEENSTLRPEQIIQIRELVKKWPDHALRTYRTLCGPQAIPQMVRLIRVKRRNEAEEAAAAKRSREELDAKIAAANAKRAAAREAKRAARQSHTAAGPGQ